MITKENIDRFLTQVIIIIVDNFSFLYLSFFYNYQLNNHNLCLNLKFLFQFAIFFQSLLIIRIKINTDQLFFFFF